MTVFCSFYESPIGSIEITASEIGVTSLYFKSCSMDHKNNHIIDCIQQLEEYFSGSRRVFDVALDLKGTAFQRLVWSALLTIPFSETRSYAEQAEKIRNPKAIRAVGAANGKNPVSIIVPCHRVIGSNGSLTGYAGGLDRKRWLLAHESRTSIHTGSQWL